MDQIPTSDVEYVAILYGAYGAVPTVDPKDAVVWDMSKKGTVFTIQSNSGMYFKINGTGTMLQDAWVDAMKDFKIQYEESVYGGKNDGIASMFDLRLVQEDDGSYSYWSQYGVVDGAWGYAGAGMVSLKVSENPTYLITYTLAGKTPVLAPL